MTDNMATHSDGQGGIIRVPLTAVQTLTREYTAQGGPFSVIHRALHSTRPWTFQIIDARPTANPQIAFARIAAPASAGYFTYKIGDTIDTGFGTNRVADDADTCLTVGRRTPNQEDCAIGAIGFGQRSARVRYSEAAIAAAIAASGGGTLSDDVQNMLRGLVPMADPGALQAPPQQEAPFNLQRVFETLIRPFLKFEIIWNGKSTIYVGMGSQFPNASAISYLNAQGEPRLDNAFTVPEGYLWRREGQGADTELELRVTLVRPVVVPISLPSLNLLAQIPAVPPVPQAFPTDLVFDLTAYLHVVAFGGVSLNAG